MGNSIKPEPEVPDVQDEDGILTYYTKEQYLQYAEEIAVWAREVALEEAANACESRFMGDLNREDLEARSCAQAIRKLKNHG